MARRRRDRRRECCTATRSSTTTPRWRPPRAITTSRRSAKRYAGQGPALFPGFDEYAEYFLREEQGSSSVNPANGEFDLAPGVYEPNGVGFSLSLNQFRLSYLQKFKLIVAPRGPLTVRAPSNWDLVQQTPYFDVWRRVRPAADVYIHLPLSGLPHERTPHVLQRPAELSAPGRARMRRSPTCSPPRRPRSRRPPAFTPTTGRPRAAQLVAYGAGSDRIAFTLPHAATYDIWMEGTVGRPVKFLIDGHAVGTLAYEERYPNQFLHIGTSTLAAGRHTLTIIRGGGSLHPGSGDDVDPDTRGLGPVVLAPQNPQTYQVRVAPAAAAARVCNAPVGYEWMEVLRPGGAPADAVSAES